MNEQHLLHHYKTETVELAHLYLVSVMNERHIQGRIAEWCTHHSPEDYHFFLDFPYRNSALAPDFQDCYQRVDPVDQPGFASLVRRVIWNYVADDYGFDPINRNSVILTEKDVATPKTPIAPETPMASDTLTRFANVTRKKVRLIHGKPEDEYTEDELVALIRKAQAAREELKDVRDTSRTLNKRYNQYADDIVIYGQLIDKLAGVE